MAIEFEVTYHQIDKTTWAILVENGEWSIGHIIKRGKRILLELWEPCGLHELEQILSKMKELQSVNKNKSRLEKDIELMEDRNYGCND